MKYLSLLALTGSSVGIGFMAQFRKRYQMKNGTGMFSMMMFALSSSLLAFLLSMVFGGFSLPSKGLDLLICLLYAMISTVCSSICLCASAWGNLTVLMMSATLGSLVLPSVYSLIAHPAENRITWLRGIGFLLAFACMAMNFLSQNSETKEENTADISKENQRTKNPSLIFKLLCVLVFFVNGSALIVYDLKLRHAICSNEVFISCYMLFSVCIALPILLGIGLCKRGRIGGELTENLRPTSLLVALGYAGSMYLSELLGLFSVAHLPLIVQSSISFAMPLIVTAVLDFLIYRVRMSKGTILQMLMAFLCCLCFAV